MQLGAVLGSRFVRERTLSLRCPWRRFLLSSCKTLLYALYNILQICSMHSPLWTRKKFFSFLRLLSSSLCLFVLCWILEVRKWGLVDDIAIVCEFWDLQNRCRWSLNELAHCFVNIRCISAELWYGAADLMICTAEINHMMLQQREEQWQTQPQMLISQMHLQMGLPESFLLLFINIFYFSISEMVGYRKILGWDRGRE